MTVNFFELLFLTQYKTKDVFISHNRVIGKGFFGYKVHSAFKSQLEYREIDFAKLIEITTEIPTFDTLFESIKVSYMPVIVTGFDLIHPSFPSTYYFLTHRLINFYEMWGGFKAGNFNTIYYVFKFPLYFYESQYVYNTFFIQKRPKMFYTKSFKFYSRFKRNYNLLIKPRKKPAGFIDPLRLQNRHLLKRVPLMKVRRNIYIKYFKRIRRCRHKKIMRALRFRLRLVNIRNFRKRKRRIKVFIPRIRYEILLFLRFSRENLLLFYNLFFKSQKSLREFFLFSLLQEFFKKKRGKRYFLEVFNQDFLKFSSVPFPLEKLAYSKTDLATAMVDRDYNKFIVKYIQRNFNECIVQENQRRQLKYSMVQNKSRKFRVKLKKMLDYYANKRNFEVELLRIY